jgi:PAS domain S-box-containing protein
MDEPAPWPEMLERQLENAQPGTHVCPIYRSPAERLRVLRAFFGGGLMRGQQCLYIAPPDQADELSQALRDLGPSVSTALDRGALVLVTARELFVRDGHFDPPAMLALHKTASQRARSSGFSALRIAGEMNWVLGADIGSQHFFEFEALLNETLPAMGGAGACMYDWYQTQPTVIQDVLQTHPVALIGEKVHDNVYYEPVDVLLGRGDFERTRADWMARRLQATTRRATALFDLCRLTLEGAAPVDMLRSAPDLITAALPLECVQLFELLPLGNAVQLVGSSGLCPATIGSVEQLDADGLIAGAMRTGQPVVIYDWQDESGLKPLVLQDESGTTGSVGVVISLGRGEGVYGFISAHSHEPRVFSDDDILLLETFGSVLAFALATARGAVSFRTLVENAPDVIVRFDSDLRVIYVNPAIERVTGTASAELIGKTSHELGVPDSLVPTWDLVLRQVWRSAREQTVDLTLSTPTGDHVFDSRIVPVTGPDGSTQSLLTVSRDVTDLRRADDERSALFEQLVAQQRRMQELMTRLVQDPERTLDRTAAESHLQYLTARERQILRLVMAGRTNAEIGAQLGLSRGTVKNHVSHILSKLNVPNRTQAAARAVELGLGA